MQRAVRNGTRREVIEVEGADQGIVNHDENLVYNWDEIKSHGEEILYREVKSSELHLKTNYANCRK